MIRVVKLASLALVLFLFAGGAHAAGRVFYDGFEDGTTNAFSAYDGRNKCVVVTSALDGGSAAQSGTRSARCNWDGVAAWNDPNAYLTMSVPSWSYTNEFLIRFWIRADADVDQTEGSKWLRLYYRPGDTLINSFYLDGRLEQSSAPQLSYLEFVDGVQGGSTCYGGQAMRPGWHKVEIYMKVGNGGTAANKVWVDDVLDCNISGYSSNPANKWYPFYIMSNWSNNPGWEHDANNHIYWDEIEIYSDTGTGGSGLMSDGTITASGGDTIFPTGVAITAPSNGATVSANTTVTASCTDNVAVANVQMLLDGGSLGAPDTSSPYSISWDTTTTGNGSHTLSARCTDTSGNSTTSSTINVTVSNVDTTPPVRSNGAPVGVLAYGTTSTSMTLTTNENATCKYGSSAGVAYASQPSTFSTTGGTSHSVTVSGLTNGGNYNRYVRCIDGAGNPNTTDYTISWSVSNTAAPVVKNECSSPPAGTIFCEDFDTGSADDAARRAKWDDYDGATDVQFPVDVGPSNDGTNHVAQFRVTPGQSGAADLVKVFGTGYDELYTRWYMKYETGFNFSAPLHGGGLALGDRNYLGNSGTRPNGSDFAYFGLQHQNLTPYNKGMYLYSYYPGMYQDCGTPGACFGDALPCLTDLGGTYCTDPTERPPTPPPAVNENEWICFETHINAGTTGATGTIDLWQNGTSMGHFTNKNLRSTTALKIENLWLSLFHHDGTHSTAGQLFDNVVVSTQRIGCNAAVSDTTAPSTPGTPVCDATSQTGISCSWTPSTDDTAVTGYRLERRTVPTNGTFAQVASPSSPSWADTVSQPTQYEYRVRAYDAAGNNSSYSGTTIVATPKDAAFAYGVSDPQLRLENLTERTKDIANLVFLGAQYARFDMTHSQVESTQGVYAWTNYDSLISELEAAGIKPFPILTYSPAWNRDGGCTTSNSAPTSNAPFAAFAAAAVQRYNLQQVEIWNEPNLLSFWCPAVNSAAYAQLLKDTYIAIKAVSPMTLVVSGGITGPTADNLPFYQGVTGFLSDLYTAGARHYFDAVGYHPYSWPSTPATAYVSGTGTGWQAMDATPTSIRSIMTANGDSIKRVWLTEWGAPTGGNQNPQTEAQQADDYLLSGMTILAGKAWAGPTFFYRLRDRCTTSTDKECFFGMVRYDESWKRSFGIFKFLANPIAAPGGFTRVPQ